MIWVPTFPPAAFSASSQLANARSICASMSCGIWNLGPGAEASHPPVSSGQSEKQQTESGLTLAGAFNSIANAHSLAVAKHIKCHRTDAVVIVIGDSRGRHLE